MKIIDIGFGIFALLAVYVVGRIVLIKIERGDFDDKFR